MRLFFLILVLILSVGVALIVFRSPKHDRDWEPALSRTPAFEITKAGAYQLHNLRAFEFAHDGVAKNEWRQVYVNPEDLHEIWFFLEPFEQWEGAAHSLLSFVFKGSEPSTLSISVEARREKGETYSGLRGALNSFELIYLWSTEKDVLSRIAIGLNHEVYAYKLEVTQEQSRAILDHFIIRTNDLSDQPRFYNTLTSNCTNELTKAVNDAFPGALPWHYSHIMTGHSAERLHQLGFITHDGQRFEKMKTDSAIGAAVRAEERTPEADFPTAWRARHHLNDTN